MAEIKFYANETAIAASESATEIEHTKGSGLGFLAEVLVFLSQLDNIKIPLSSQTLTVLLAELGAKTLNLKLITLYQTAV